MKHKTLELIIFIVAIIGIGTALVLVYQNRKPRPLLPTEIVMSPTSIPTYTITPKPTKIIPTPTNPVPTEYRNLKAYEVTNGSKPGWKKIVSEKYKVSFEYPVNPFTYIGPTDSNTHPYFSTRLGLNLYTNETNMSGNSGNFSAEIVTKEPTLPPVMPDITVTPLFIGGVQAYKTTYYPRKDIGREAVYGTGYIVYTNGIYYRFGVSAPTVTKLNKYSKYLQSIISTVKFLR